MTNLLYFDVGQTVLRSKPCQEGGNDATSVPESLPDSKEPNLKTRDFTEEPKNPEVTPEPVRIRVIQPIFGLSPATRGRSNDLSDNRDPHLANGYPSNGSPNLISGHPDNDDPHLLNGHPDNGDPHLDFPPVWVDDHICGYLMIIDHPGTIKDKPPDLSEFRRTVVRVVLFSRPLVLSQRVFQRKVFNEAIRITHAEFVRAETSPGPFDDRPRVKVDLIYHLDRGPPSPLQRLARHSLMPNQSGINRVSIPDQSRINPINQGSIRNPSRSISEQSGLNADLDFFPFLSYSVFIAEILLKLIKGASHSHL